MNVWCNYIYYVTLGTTSHPIPFHSNPFQSIPIYSNPFQSIPFHSIPSNHTTVVHHTTPHHTTPHHTTPHHTTPPHRSSNTRSPMRPHSRCTSGSSGGEQGEQEGTVGCPSANPDWRNTIGGMLSGCGLLGVPSSPSMLGGIGSSMQPHGMTDGALETGGGGAGWCSAVVQFGAVWCRLVQ